MRFDSRAWVGKLSVPISVVIPTEDLLVPTVAQRELASLIDGAHVVELTGCGHESILTRAKEYIAVIDEVMADDSLHREPAPPV